MKFIERHRLAFSIALGLILSVIVLLIWSANNRSLQNSLKNNVEVTGNLVVQQFQEVLYDNVNRLNNLKHRLEVTNGSYFDYWNSDAALIIEQEPSFLFVEWIDSSMVIQKVEPLEGNEEAIGLDISELDYRNSDWNNARRDSTVNITHWLPLVQGDHAFLVDAPVYIQGNFYGTITAGMDFTLRFNEIMQGLEEYHVRMKDDKGTTFYTYGSTNGIEDSRPLTTTDTVMVGDINNSRWTVTLIPNRLFMSQNSVGGLRLNLILALILCVLLSVSFYFMQQSLAAERSSRRANNKLRALIESSPIGIYVLNERGVIVDFWNDAAERMLGWKKEEVINRYLPEVIDVKDKVFSKLMTQSLNNGALVNKEITRKRKDGSTGRFRLNVGTITEGEKQMLVLLEDISKEKQYESKLEKSLHEKEVLLAEIHHRVKNNLAIIIGLIELQKEEMADEQTAFLLNETQNRIYSISGVHELLYQTENFSEISIGEYVDNLLDRIKMTFKKEGSNVTIRRDVNSLHVNINQAIPLGLLLNELITNSFKHAFKGREAGEIWLELHEKNDSFEVFYKDNGIGLDQSVFENASSLGITLIKTLLAQLSADYRIEQGEGFAIRFQFPIKDIGPHSAI